MDKITLLDKNMNFLSKYAAPSVSTGYFVAAIVDSDRTTIEDAFTNPGRILVHNVEKLCPDEVYTGYTHINEIRESQNDITVLLDKEGS